MEIVGFKPAFPIYGNVEEQLRFEANLTQSGVSQKFCIRVQRSPVAYAISSGVQRSSSDANFFLTPIERFELSFQSSPTWRTQAITFQYSTLPMAAMRPLRALRALRALTVLGTVPLVHAAAVVPTQTCRASPLLALSQHCAAYSTHAAPASTFTYRIAAAFAGKYQHFDPRLDLYAYPPTSQSFLRDPRTGKPRYNSGQDAFLVTHIGNASSGSAGASRGRHMVFGVADGVGGWEDSGVDPADFSHGLCGYIEQRATQVAEEEQSATGPLELLQAGYDDLMADDSVRAGGSTAIVAVGRPDGVVEVAK